VVCSVLQYVAVCCSVWKVLLRCIRLPIRCVCCSVLCVAMCRSVLWWDVVDFVAACSVADHECGL